MLNQQRDRSPSLLSFDAEGIYEQVWRFDLTAPGFFLLDAGPEMDSHTLRAWMVKIQGVLSAVHVRRTGKPFVFRSLTRFDQQVTTRFHRDGGPEESMLMLGYEPSKVHSRLFLADYTRAAFDRGITPQQFLDKFNPMFHRDEESLAGYITELPPATEGHARILLINNSLLPFTEAGTNPLGVLHKAEIVNPRETERRIVNSTMLVTEGEQIGSEQVAQFLTTDQVSGPVSYSPLR